MEPREARAKEILESIRRVLLEEWDPIGVNDVAEAQDEYDSYIGGVHRLLASGASADQVEAHLRHLETVTMGISDHNRARATRCDVARKLRSLDLGP
jgi:hypothetical protein